MRKLRLRGTVRLAQDVAMRKQQRQNFYDAQTKLSRYIIPAPVTREAHSHHAQCGAGDPE